MGKPSIPREKLSIRMGKVLIPREKIAIRMEKVSIPREKVSIRMEKVSIPREKVSIRMEKVSIPREKVSIRMEKVSIAPFVDAQGAGEQRAYADRSNTSTSVHIEHSNAWASRMSIDRLGTFTPRSRLLMNGSFDSQRSASCR
jgi:hypothetical protein